MLGLPASTEIHKQLPKTALAHKFNLKPEGVVCSTRM